jgi:hypothetical protein
MINRSVIVFVIDGWSPGHLEAYGSGNVKTPSLNSIASQAILYDNCLADGSTLTDVYGSFFSGEHTLQQFLKRNVSSTKNLAQKFRELGKRTLLLQDGQLPELQPFHAGFDDVEIWDEPLPCKMANTIEETRMARFADLAANLIEQATVPDMTWVHVSGFRNAWDGPRELRSALLDEDDPEAPTFLHPVLPQSGDKPDPDVLLLNQSAYGAQIAVWDSCLDLVWDSFLRRSERHPTLLILTSSGGISLGEHPSLGAKSNLLHSEFVHLPLLFVDSTMPQGAFRTVRLTQPHELNDIILSFVTDTGKDVNEGSRLVTHPVCRHALLEADPNQIALTHSPTHWAVRTLSWYVTFPKNLAAQDPIEQFSVPDDLGGVELFAKPDDRWEDNELSHRCPDVVQDLAARGQDYLRSKFTGSHL